MQDKTKVLQHELDELQAQIAARKVALEDKPDYGLGKGAPAVTRWELDRVLLQRLKKRAARLERALSQINEDTYGICAQCGSPIHPDRLAVLPATRMCIRCAHAGEHEGVAPQSGVPEMAFQS
jgi:RNA polymerase-binding transcription factor DksA